MSKKHAIIKEDGFIYFSPTRGMVAVKNTVGRYAELLQNLLSDEFNDADFLKKITNACSPTLEEASGGKVVVSEDKITAEVDDQILVLPTDIRDAVEKLMKAGAEYSHLENFWRRCLKNPNRGSIEQLYGFLSRHLMTITEDGCFIAYKYVTRDYMDCYTQTKVNTPGTTVTMDRGKVTFDPNIACSSGLHVGSLDYVLNFGRSSHNRIVIVKVDPADVVSVPFDYDFQKIRVCAYTVLADWNEPVECSSPVIKDDLSPASASSTIDPDREWTDTEVKSLQAAVDAAPDTVMLLVPSYATLLRRSVDSVTSKLRELIQAKNTPAQPAWERVGSAKLNVDRRKVLYELVEKYGHEWGKIFEHMQNMFDSLDVSVDTLRKIAKRMGL